MTAAHFYIGDISYTYMSPSLFIFLHPLLLFHVIFSLCAFFSTWLHSSLNFVFIFVALCIYTLDLFSLNNTEIQVVLHFEIFVGSLDRFAIYLLLFVQLFASCFSFGFYSNAVYGIPLSWCCLFYLFSYICLTVDTFNLVKFSVSHSIRWRRATDDIYNFFFL